MKEKEEMEQMEEMEDDEQKWMAEKVDRLNK